MIDIIDECGKDLTALGYKCRKEKEFDLEICSLIVDNEQKRQETGFDIGEYLILNCPYLALGGEIMLEYVAKNVAKAIKFLMDRNGLTKKSRILVVGLGNPKLLADSLGVKTLEYTKLQYFKKETRLFKFAPNIFFNTGINSLDVVGMLSVCLDVDGVVIIDSLATESVDRIACSIQLNTAGITPGSALNNLGKHIGRESLGLPCISIGVPLMFLGKKLGKEDLILTTKDIHENVDDLAYVIGKAINISFS